jgi:hypothetical protein
MFYRFGCFCQERSLLNQARNNAFNQGDFRVFKTLKAPAIKFEAENALLSIERSFDHLKDARFSCAPVTVHADSYRVFGPFPQQRDDRFSDRLIIEEINLGLVV